MRYSFRVILAAWLAAVLASAFAIPLPPPPAFPAGAPLTAGAAVIVHPDAPRYVGDQLSLEVRLDAGLAAGKDIQRVEVFAGAPADQPVASPDLWRDPASGTLRANLDWAWDTAGLPPGRHTLTFRTQPDRIQWTETIWLEDPASRPAVEQNARWVERRTACCQVYVIRGTDAERDLDELAALVEEEYRRVQGYFPDAEAPEITLSFLPRTLGHGGFAGDEIYVSYLDRNYATPLSARMIIRHELVHRFDRLAGGNLHPALLAEGLAVYFSGGHFQPEPLLPRARALLDLGLYAPLPELSQNFYQAQHESGYLQGAAFIAYLVDRAGWEQYMAFYSDIHPHDAGESAALEDALQRHYALSLADADRALRAFLAAQPADPAQTADLAWTVRFFDTVREYQRTADPTAHFRSAWLPDGAAMRERGLTADYLRHPTGVFNRAVEDLLIRAAHAADQDRLEQAGALLDKVSCALTQYRQRAERSAPLLEPAPAQPEWRSRFLNQPLSCLQLASRIKVGDTP